ncbi:hypothetical protein D3C71_1400400 [compost metagenome]
MTNCFSSIIKMSSDSWNVKRRWQVINNSIQHKLNPFVTVGGSNNYREQFNFNYAFAQCSFNFRNCNFFAFQVLHSQIFIKFSNFLDQLETQLLNFGQIFFRNIRYFDVLA